MTISSDPLRHRTRSERGERRSRSRANRGGSGANAHNGTLGAKQALQRDLCEVHALSGSWAGGFATHAGIGSGSGGRRARVCTVCAASVAEGGPFCEHGVIHERRRAATSPRRRRAACTHVARLRRAMTSGWPKSAGPCCITRLAPPASPATRSGARRPSPRPARADGDARRAEGGASTIGAEPAAGWRTIFLPVIRQGRRAATRQDAHAQPERPWRRCAGVIASGRPKSAGSGGHNALRARDAGAGSGANCRAPSRRPPGRGGCARRGGARIHDGEGAGRDGRREDGRVRPAFRSSRRSDPSILQNDVYR